MLLLQINLQGSTGPGSSAGGPMLGLLFPLNMESLPNQSLLVMAMQDGYYQGLFHPKGDVFYILNAADFSDSSVSLVPPGNPDYPIYGWMQFVSPQPVFLQSESLESWDRNYIPRRVL